MGLIFREVPSLHLRFRFLAVTNGRRLTRTLLNSMAGLFRTFRFLGLNVITSEGNGRGLVIFTAVRNANDRIRIRFLYLGYYLMISESVLLVSAATTITLFTSIRRLTTRTITSVRRDNETSTYLARLNCSITTDF